LFAGDPSPKDSKQPPLDCSPFPPLVCQAFSVSVFARVESRCPCDSIEQLAQIFALIGLDEDLVGLIQSIEGLYGLPKCRNLVRLWRLLAQRGKSFDEAIENRGEQAKCLVSMLFDPPGYPTAKGVSLFCIG
jgi:hypothetical protein